MMQEYRSNSYLFGSNAPYVEELYEAYLDNPTAVPDRWRAYFDALQNVPAADGSDSRDVAHAPVVESFAQRAKANAFAVKASVAELAVARKEVHVQSLIAAYRSLGARWADLHPLKREGRRSGDQPIPGKVLLGGRHGSRGGPDYHRIRNPSCGMIRTDRGLPLTQRGGFLLSPRGWHAACAPDRRLRT